MPTNKEQLVSEIGKCRGASFDDHDVIRKMFLVDPTFVFREHGINGYRILNKISQKFKIPLIITTAIAN